MLVRQFVSAARRVLGSLYTENESKAIVARLCEEILGLQPYAHIIEPSLTVPLEQEDRLFRALQRLCGGMPLQYALGYADFCGFRFNVNPSVLIPRPETEQLCSLVLESVGAGVEAAGSRILDLCSGSGCISWTLALSLPGAQVVGVDISDEALRTAAAQPLEDEASRRGARIPTFIKYDILRGPEDFSAPSAAPTMPHSAAPDANQDPAALPEEYDIIVSNPPYVRESERKYMSFNVLDYEPALALFVPDEIPLIFYKAIADFAKTRLRPGGLCCVEINEALEGPTAAIFQAAGFSDVEILKDFRAKFRFIRFRK